MAKQKAASASSVRAAIAQLKKLTGWNNSGLISLLRGGGSSGKGSGYEREFCTMLSLWWTDGKRDDIFWRSSNSGGRATVRGRRGKQTQGQHGDVAATCPTGNPLMDLLTFELKRGYSEQTVQDVLDRPLDAAQQEWEGFLMQAMNSHADAGSLSWVLVVKRDRRRAWLWLPSWVMGLLRTRSHALCSRGYPRVQMRCQVRSKDKLLDVWEDVSGMPVDEFFDRVTPKDIMRLGHLT